MKNARDKPGRIIWHTNMTRKLSFQGVLTTHSNSAKEEDRATKAWTSVLNDDTGGKDKTEG